MTREEFSKQLRKYRDESGVTLKDLCVALNSLQNTVYRIEKGSNNYSVEKAIKYADTVGAVIVASNEAGNTIILNSPETAISMLKFARGETSIYKVAKDNGYSTTAITRAENGMAALSIDMLLKLLEYYQYGVAIRK